MTAIRIVDLSAGEYIEVPSDELAQHLFTFIETLEKEQVEILDELKSRLESVDMAIVIMTEYLAGHAARGSAAVVHNLFDRVTKLAARMERLYLHANNFAKASKTIVRLTLMQAREFGY